MFRSEAWMGLGAEPLAQPGGAAGVVPGEALEGEAPVKAGGAPGGDERRLDGQRARAAHGVEEGAVAVPAGHPEQRGRQRLAQRRGADAGAPATAVERLAGRLDRE
jgi:hypothetical protein